MTYQIYIKCLKKPNWREADQLAIYKAQPRSWTRGNREQIQSSSIVEGMVSIHVVCE